MSVNTEQHSEHKVSFHNSSDICRQRETEIVYAFNCVTDIFRLGDEALEDIDRVVGYLAEYVYIVSCSGYL